MWGLAIWRGRGLALLAAELEHLGVVIRGVPHAGQTSNELALASQLEGSEVGSHLDRLQLRGMAGLQVRMQGRRPLVALGLGLCWTQGAGPDGVACPVLPRSPHQVQQTICKPAVTDVTYT